MINRILIRIKVIQTLYSFLLVEKQFSIESNPSAPTKEKRFAYSLYLDMLVLLIKLCVACMMAAFTEYYKYPEKEEIIKAEYQKALRILCYGAYKTPQKDRLEEKVNE